MCWFWRWFGSFKPAHCFTMQQNSTRTKTCQKWSTLVVCGHARQAMPACQNRSCWPAVALRKRLFLFLCTKVFFNLFWEKDLCRFSRQWISQLEHKRPLGTPRMILFLLEESAEAYNLCSSWYWTSKKINLRQDFRRLSMQKGSLVNDMSFFMSQCLKDSFGVCILNVLWSVSDVLLVWLSKIKSCRSSLLG
jgi:hypothetical protein